MATRHAILFHGIRRVSLKLFSTIVSNMKMSLTTGEIWEQCNESYELFGAFIARIVPILYLTLS